MEDLKNSNGRNTVRAHGAPFARPRAALSRKVSINRESNALRASVFDAAMQIGLGSNGAVTDWIYNNSVNEEEEVRYISLFKSGFFRTIPIRCEWTNIRSFSSSTPFLLSYGHSSESAASKDVQKRRGASIRSKAKWTYLNGLGACYTTTFFFWR